MKARQSQPHKRKPLIEVVDAHGKPHGKTHGKPAPTPRLATKEEQEGFLGRLSELLDRTKWRLARLTDPNYELRMRPVREHTVRSHVRGASERPYLMKRPKTT